MNRAKTAKLVRLAVYAMLVISAVTAFALGDRIWAAARSGSVPIWLALVPAIAFTAFVVVYAIDRILLVTRRNYPAARALFQILFALIFLLVLWPHQRARMPKDIAPNAEGNDTAVRLLQHRNPEVRALACEVLGRRNQVEAASAVARVVEKDGSAEVRQVCREALQMLREERPHERLEPPAPNGAHSPE